jgi:hypothetical protein
VVVGEEVDEGLPAALSVHPTEVLVFKTLVEAAQRAVRAQRNVMQPSQR